MATYNELVTTFSFVGSTAPLANFNDLVEQSTDSLAEQDAGLAEVEQATVSFQAAIAGATTVLTGVVAGMTAWVNSISQTIDPIVQMSRVTGVAVESIQEWGYAASVSGSSQEAVAESMRELSMRMGEFARSGGGPAAEVIKSFGINIKDANGEIMSAGDMLSVVNEQMQGLSQGAKLDLLDKLGIDKSLVQLLGSTSDNVEQLRKRAQLLGITTQAEADSFANYNDSLTTVGFAVESLSRKVAVNMIPSLKDGADGFVNFITENQKWITDLATTIGKFLGAVIASFKRMAPVLAVATVAMTAFWFATGGAATAMAILTSPITIVIAAVGALYLVIDDLITAMDGGQSIIASFFNDYWDFDIVPVIQSVKEAVMDVFAYMENMAQPLLDIFSNVFSLIFSIFTLDGKGAADAIKGIFTGLGEYIYNILVKFPSDAFKLITGNGEGFFNGLANIGKTAFEKLASFVKDLFSNLFGGIFDSAKEGVMSLVPDFLLPDSAKTQSTALDQARSNIDNQTFSTSSVNNDNSMSQSNQINVYSSDPVAAGQQVNDVLNNSYKNARLSSARGGM